nr:MAG TPA: hypothetical protein [Caudoviricetes sp.]
MRKSGSMGTAMPLMCSIFGFGLNIFLLRDLFHKCDDLIVNVLKHGISLGSIRKPVRKNSRRRAVSKEYINTLVNSIAYNVNILSALKRVLKTCKQSLSLFKPVNKRFLKDNRVYFFVYLDVADTVSKFKAHNITSVFFMKKAAHGKFPHTAVSEFTQQPLNNTCQLQTREHFHPFQALQKHRSFSRNNCHTWKPSQQETP